MSLSQEVHRLNPLLPQKESDAIGPHRQKPVQCLIVPVDPVFLSFHSKRDNLQFFEKGLGAVD